jgi:hypothetical protein
MLLVLTGFENLDSRLGSFHLRKGLAFTFQISGSVNLVEGLLAALLVTTVLG